jgi:leucyl aminopeptidase
MHPVFVTSDAQTVPVWFANTGDLSAVVGKIGGAAGAFAKAAGFDGKPGQHLMMPGGGGKLAAVLFGLEAADDPKKDVFLPGRLAGLLPDGTYRFANAPHDARLAALAFALGTYEFARYRKGNNKKLKLRVPNGVDAKELGAQVEAVMLARDLINTPSNDLGPAELEAAARKVAKAHHAKMTTVSGPKLVRRARRG